MQLLILVHIVGGSIALASGGAALTLRKGSPLHARAGSWFFASMLVMTVSGAIIAGLKPERGTAVVGLLTAYLVVTSWVTARRRSGVAGRFELGAFAFASACAIAQLSFGIQGLNSPTGLVDSLPAAVHFPFAALMALAAALDLSFILRRRLTPAQRVARHLWRMSAALLIAAFSFFLGQQKVMPDFIQGSPLLFVPPLAVFGSMLFWILRVRFAKAWRRGPRQAAVAAREAAATA
jgi:uncharacterized membrane protein